MPGLNRFLRVTPGGLLRVDKQKIRTETNLDGKYLLRCSDPHLSAEDIALGYKQLLEVERGWRDMKQILDLRPVYHRREDRIRAHVLLCWLALLLIRVAETTAGGSWTWNRIRAELQRIHAVTCTGPAGTFQYSSAGSHLLSAILIGLSGAEMGMSYHLPRIVGTSVAAATCAAPPLSPALPQASAEPRFEMPQTRPRERSSLRASERRARKMSVSTALSLSESSVAISRYDSPCHSRIRIARR